MVLWRLVPEQWARTAWDGEGARLLGGRWNSEGTAVVYLSATLSLAALEVLAHAAVENLPDRYAALSIEVPAGVLPEPVDPAALSAHWRGPFEVEALQRFGDEWARSRRSLLLEVPSAIIPGEKNYVLNPGHPDMPRLKHRPAERFRFDSRLLN